MKKKVTIICLILLTINSPQLKAQIALVNGIVKIDYVDNENNKGNGTGIVFYKDTENKLYILTALHVVSDDFFSYKQLTVSFLQDPGLFPAEISYKYKKYDIAVLVVNDYPPNVPLLYLGTNNDKQLGESISMYGYPEQEFEYKGGSIRKLSGDKIILDNIIPSAGNSGGPIIFNDTDEVIGIVLQKAENPEHDQYAFNIDMIKTLLQNTEILNKSIIDPNNNLTMGGSNYSQMFSLD